MKKIYTRKYFLNYFHFRLIWTKWSKINIKPNYLWDKMNILWRRGFHSISTSLFPFLSISAFLAVFYLRKLNIKTSTTCLAFLWEQWSQFGSWGRDGGKGNGGKEGGGRKGRERDEGRGNGGRGGLSSLIRYALTWLPLLSSPSKPPSLSPPLQL